MNPKKKGIDKPCCTMTTVGKQETINDTTNRILESKDPLLSTVAMDAIERSRIENAY